MNYYFTVSSYTRYIPPKKSEKKPKRAKDFGGFAPLLYKTIFLNHLRLVIN